MMAVCIDKQKTESVQRCFQVTDTCKFRRVRATRLVSIMGDLIETAALRQSRTIAVEIGYERIVADNKKRRLGRRARSAFPKPSLEGCPSIGGVRQEMTFHLAMTGHGLARPRRSTTLTSSAIASPHSLRLSQ